MKKILVAFCIMFSLNSYADTNNVAAAIVGGFIGYAINSPGPRYIEQRQVIIQPQVLPQPPVYIEQQYYYQIPRRPVYRPITYWNEACRCYTQYWEQVN